MRNIVIDDLSRDYGKGHGVFNLTFSVDEGEVFGFLGPNGAGKTTTIRHLMGFIKPQSGSCSIGGRDCWRQSSAIQDGLGYLSGEIAFFDGMTGTDFLHFTRRYRGMKTAGRTQELLERFELDPHMKIRKMSKGMKQKLGIVTAFAHDPKVLILDEPTSGLDPLMQNRFIELIGEEKARGKTVLMSSHMFEEVERTCHRIAIIKDGRMVAMDSVDALRARQVKKYTITFESPEAAAAFAKEDLEVSELAHNRVTVVISNDIKGLIALMNRYPVTNISAPGLSLEEVFMHFYGGDV